MITWPDFKFPPVNLFSMPKQKVDFERADTISYLKELAIERYAMREEIKRTQLHHELAGNAMKYHYERVRMIDFLTFCRTGKYPND